MVGGGEAYPEPVGSTWFTTLTAIREAEPDWQAIACYREPIGRFLRHVYPRLPRDLHDDVVQEVLCAMHASVVARFDPDRGRFRDYLRGVIRNQVKRALTRERAAAGVSVDLSRIDPEQVMQASQDQVEAVDLSAQLVRAVRAFHDAKLGGAPEDRETLYCLSDRLLHGLTYAQIAAKEGLSTDAVKRRLQAARRGILRALLQAELDDRGLALDPRRLNALAESVASAVCSTRPVDDLLPRQDVEQAVAADLVEAVRTGVRLFPGLDSPDGQAFVSALEGILDP